MAKISHPVHRGYGTQVQYDYFIVGAGLYGAVFARQMTDADKKCLIVERRGHIAGNACAEKIAEIDVHVLRRAYFYTFYKRVWMFVNRFSSFNDSIHTAMANYRGELYNRLLICTHSSACGASQRRSRRVNLSIAAGGRRRRLMLRPNNPLW